MKTLGRHHVQTSLFGLSSAVISDCQTYRYRLDRVWDKSLPPLAFGMLNPSTADHENNDPTIERCERRARALGFGSLIVWNLFAFRATDPKFLKQQQDPIGPDNDHFILEALSDVVARAGSIIAAWGAHGTHMERSQRVLDLTKELRIKLLCFGQTASGQPKHPLYLSYGVTPTVFRELPDQPGPRNPIACFRSDLMPS
jgi:hypothetical protein